MKEAKVYTRVMPMRTNLLFLFFIFSVFVPSEFRPCVLDSNGLDLKFQLYEVDNLSIYMKVAVLCCVPVRFVDP